MNHAELLKAAYAPLRDNDRKQIDQDDMTDLLNDAYVDLATRLELLVKEKTGTTSGNTLAIPDGTAADPAAIRIEQLRVAGKEVEFTDQQTWQSWSDAASTPTRTLARPFGSNIELYPTPTTGSAYALRYVYIPSGTTQATRRLDDPTDVPLLPAHLHRKLVVYAQAEAYAILGELDKHDRAQAKYEAGLPPPRLGGGLRFPSPDSLLVVPGPFDRVDSKHI